MGNNLSTTRISPAIDQLVGALRALPGVGPKSALRLALFLLERSPAKAKTLSQSIDHALDVVRHCERCRNLTQQPLCEICSDTSRQFNTLCVVESPLDVLAIEQTGHYRGCYFVLLGCLSPMDGIGPEALGLNLLADRLAREDIIELILATNLHAEGEATAHYISQLALRSSAHPKQHSIQVSRLASGVPMGGELEYLDSHTLSHALLRRQQLVPEID